MKTEKKEWSDRVMASAADLKKLRPLHSLDEKVFSAIKESKAAAVVNFSQFKYGVAAALAILILNAVIILSVKQNEESGQRQGYLQSYNLNIY